MSLDMKKITAKAKENQKRRFEAPNESRPNKSRAMVSEENVKGIYVDTKYKRRVPQRDCSQLPSLKAWLDQGCSLKNQTNTQVSIKDKATMDSLL
jgi:hypothetical protein